MALHDIPYRLGGSSTLSSIPTGEITDICEVCKDTSINAVAVGKDDIKHVLQKYGTPQLPYNKDRISLRVEI